MNTQNRIRKHWGFISGSKMAPKDKNSEEYKTWEDENYMVKSWLLDAMTKDIKFSFAYLLPRRFGRPHNKLIISAKILQRHISYIIRYTTMVNSQRLYVFLAGLDSHLDGVRGRVLATTPLPTLQVAYAIVCAEANRQDAMLGVTSNEGAVMAIRKSGARPEERCSVRRHLPGLTTPRQRVQFPRAISSLLPDSLPSQNQDEIRFFEIMRSSSIEAETAETSSIECSVEGREDQVHDSTLSPTTSTNPQTQSSLEDSLEKTFMQTRTRSWEVEKAVPPNAIG
ncbi:hypothetical protein HHK36_004003 [Tetracentron sinense]|uniref:Uncharacterized protein n=1 Tax=Tetracentron sinense TaxID=13715 RepID=A0A835DT06_TETSI|nr:hypothetical protein HHK36_004003 [Tetracentron sinense]